MALLCAVLAGLWWGGLRAAHGDPRLPVESLHGAHWSMQVVDLADGHVVFEHAADDLMVPASTMKLMTAAAVLLEPPTPSLTTEAKLDGRGRLWLRASGDPSWTTLDISELALVYASAGATEVILDDRFVWGRRLGPGWAWDDETEDYSAPLGAFGVNENTVLIRVTPALAVAAPPRVETDPAGVLEMENGASTGGPQSDDTLEMRRVEGSNRVRLAGVIPSGEVVEDRISVFHGTEYFAMLLRQALEHFTRASVRRVTDGDGAPTGRVVWARQSAVGPLVSKMLKESDNYYAEQLMRWLGTRPQPSDGLDRAGLVLERLGVKRGAYRQVDGSGLSRMNLLSAAQLVSVLRGMASASAFVDALPVAGVDGTLARRFKTSRLRGLLRAKTGSMSGVSSLAGYLCDASGRPRYAFAFILNGAVAPMREVKVVEEATVEAVLGPLVAR